MSLPAISHATRTPDVQPQDTTTPSPAKLSSPSHNVPQNDWKTLCTNIFRHGATAGEKLPDLISLIQQVPTLETKIPVTKRITAIRFQLLNKISNGHLQFPRNSAPGLPAAAPSVPPNPQEANGWINGEPHYGEYSIYAPTASMLASPKRRVFEAITNTLRPNRNFPSGLSSYLRPRSNVNSTKGSRIYDSRPLNQRGATVTEVADRKTLAPAWHEAFSIPQEFSPKEQYLLVKLFYACLEDVNNKPDIVSAFAQNFETLARALPDLAQNPKTPVQDKALKTLEEMHTHMTPQQRQGVLTALQAAQPHIAPGLAARVTALIGNLTPAPALPPIDEITIQQEGTANAPQSRT